ncbi:MAG: hypothetical protein GY714_05335 [Desulfobacterales bacterium]|nr:hypothetical protein [Desulfobacterales bacterium]
MDLLKNNWSKWNRILMNGLTDSELHLLEINYPLEVGDNRNINLKKSLSQDFIEQNEETLYEFDSTDPEEIINQLQNKQCCKNNCLKKINQCSLINRIIEFKKMSKTDKEKAVLLIIKLGQNDDNSEKDLSTRQKRHYYEFLFNKKISVCRNAFLSIHNISIRQLKRLQKVAISESFKLPEHGNKNRKPIHSTSEEEAEKVRKFLELFASNHGMPLPGGIGKFSKTGIMLPVHYNYKKIWEIYKSGPDNSYSISYRSFINIWQSGCEHIMFRGPGTDLCDTCIEITNKLMRTRSEDIQKQLLTEINTHVADYSLARDQYRQNIAKSKKSWSVAKNTAKKKLLSRYSKDKFPTNKVNPCSTSIISHYSFDFSQKVHYPFSPYQRSSSYFLVPRKCDIFGIVNDTISKEILFLVDELELVGKGANAVISYLHAFFELYGLGEKVAYLQADNCVGQNKNKYVMWYLLWRILNGLHEKITLSFMVKGHTKFSPDGYFGLFKIQYQKQNIDWIGDVVECAREASRDSIIPLPYGISLKRKKPLFHFYDWKSFLSKFFKDIPEIASYSYFLFSNDSLGNLRLKKNPNDTEKTMLLLKNEHKRFTGPIKMPKILEPLEISQDRREYLNRKIAPLVSELKNREYYSLEELSLR